MSWRSSHCTIIPGQGPQDTVDLLHMPVTHWILHKYLLKEWMGEWMNVWINDFVPIQTWDGAKSRSPSLSEWSWTGTAVLQKVGRGKAGSVLPSNSQEGGPSPLRFAACSAQVSLWGEMSLIRTQNTSPYSPSLSIFSRNFCCSLLWWSSNSSSWALRMRKHSDLINTRNVCRHTDK